MLSCMSEKNALYTCRGPDYGHSQHEVRVTCCTDATGQPLCDARRPARSRGKHPNIHLYAPLCKRPKLAATGIYMSPTALLLGGTSVTQFSCAWTQIHFAYSDAYCCLTLAACSTHSLCTSALQQLQDESDC